MKSKLELQQERDGICKVLKEAKWPMRARDIAELVNLANSVVSNHLIRLRGRGVIKAITIKEIKYSHFYMASLGEKKAAKQLKVYAKMIKETEISRVGEGKADILQLSREFYRRISA